MLSVTYFYRAPRKTGVSIEGIFKAVKKCLSGTVDINEFYCDATKSRMRNTLNARKNSADITHITGDVNYLAIGLSNKKNILTIHDFGHYENLKKRSWLRFVNYRLFWFVLPLRNIAIVTVVSEYTKQKLIEYLGFPTARIRVIHDPVKPIFKLSRRSGQNEIPRILQIGTGPHKNLHTLIEAVNGMKVHLDIVGYPCENDISKLGTYNIAHTIYNDLTEQDIYDRYIACDLLYFASFHEGFGMPIIEAQSVGRPVITSNYGAMKEVAKNSAILVDPNNAAQITGAITTLLGNQNEYDNYVEAGLENIIPYEYTKIAAQYLAVYKELASEK